MSLSVDPTLRNLNDCGCCAGERIETPQELANRPNLRAIAYRIGTHPQFKQSMLASLSLLPDLKTREPDDFTIGLLDAWATVADVLTFYQERIANESYLRTATERLSVTELARLLGYELNPGVAASTYLAFTLEDAPGSPGHATIDIGTKAQSLPGPGQKPQTYETIERIQARSAWNLLHPRQTQAQPLAAGGIPSVLLAGVGLNLKAGNTVLIVASDHWSLRRILAVTQNDTEQTTHLDLSLNPVINTTSLTKEGVFAMRVQSGPFGHNAPQKPVFNSGQFSGNFTEWGFEESPETTNPLINLYLDSVHEDIERENYVVTERGSAQLLLTAKGNKTVSRANYGISSRVTLLDNGDPWFPGGVPANATLSAFREVAVYAQTDKNAIPLAEVPDTSFVQGKTIELDKTVDGLTEGKKLLFVGLGITADDLSKENFSFALQDEIAVVDSAATSNGRTTITLKADLRSIYARKGLNIYGNIALATHGETRNEVLGNGDSGRRFQSFPLRQSPLTYIPDNSPTGASSTLEVRVNDLLWKEVPFLFGHGRRERIYITRRNSEGKVTLQFGDSATGARLPGGVENVKATYREGIGLEGEVLRGQLSLLLTRPLGVKSVLNPTPGTGAADPEKTEDARDNAPRTVLTLGRIVSLQDYADFARGFAGIGKSHAVWVWDKLTRGVFITVAGVGGKPVPEDSELFVKLSSALHKAADPRVPIFLTSYTPVLFRLAATILVDPVFRKERVLQAAKDALAQQFSFEARDFGRNIALSEVETAIQNVAGVIAVNFTALYRPSSPAALVTPLLGVASAPGLYPLLQAFTTAPGTKAEEALAAELLAIDPTTLNQVELK